MRALVLALAVAGCTDPCAGSSGSCIALTVTGSISGIELLQVTVDPATYGGCASGCLNSGFALRIVTPNGRRDLILCLECQYVHLPPYLEGTRHILSDSGAERFRQIYRTLFGKRLTE